MPFVQIRVTPDGVTEAKQAAVMSSVTEVLCRELGKDPEDVYIVFEVVDPRNWAVAGRSVHDRASQPAP